MRKVIGVLALLLLFVPTESDAYVSGIAIQSDGYSEMQVFINGKLYNKQPGKFVRIKSLPGNFSLQIKVLNPYDKRWYIVHKKVTVEKGFEFYYRMVFQKGKRPAIQEVKKYPVYTRYFLNPTLYNRNPVS